MRGSVLLGILVVLSVVSGVVVADSHSQKPSATAEATDETTYDSLASETTVQYRVNYSVSEASRIEVRNVDNDSLIGSAEVTAGDGEVTISKTLGGDQRGTLIEVYLKSEDGNNQYVKLAEQDSADGNQTFTLQQYESNQAPTAGINAPEEGDNVTVGESVMFDGSDSYDPDSDDSLQYYWDFDGDGETDKTGREVSSSYSESGEAMVILTVRDGSGSMHQTTQKLTVGEREAIWGGGGANVGIDEADETLIQAGVLVAFLVVLGHFGYRRRC